MAAGTDRRERASRAILRRLRAACGSLALLVAFGGSGEAQTVFDFVSLDRIDYIRWADEPGRALVPSELGVEFATVQCSISEDPRGCAYGVDAAAAFMPAGTRMYAVRGYATEFRLAAVWKDRIFLYQAWRNPRAKVGGALYELAGKVRAIDVQRGRPTPAEASARARVTSPRDAEALVEMIVHGAVRPPQAHAVGEPRYWLTFWFADGTTLGRAYFPQTGELMGGVVVPGEFQTILERYLER
jgi:hypothetical protein